MSSHSHTLDAPSANSLPLEPMLRLPQVMKILGCSRSTLYSGIASGRYPAPLKNGKISLWTTESIRAWISDPENFQTFAQSKASMPRNLAKSAVFSGKAAEMVQVDHALEVMGLSILLAHFDKFHAAQKSNKYDQDSAVAVRSRLEELKLGAPPAMNMLRRWKPAAAQK